MNQGRVVLLKERFVRGFKLLLVVSLASIFDGSHGCRVEVWDAETHLAILRLLRGRRRHRFPRIHRLLRSMRSDGGAINRVETDEGQDEINIQEGLGQSFTIVQLRRAIRVLIVRISISFATSLTHLSPCCYSEPSALMSKAKRTVRRCWTPPANCSVTWELYLFNSSHLFTTHLSQY